MNQISEPARAVDVICETDVLVVGSGPGGLARANAFGVIQNRSRRFCHDISASLHTKPLLLIWAIDIAQFDVDAFQLRVVIDGSRAVFPAKPGLFVAANR